VLENEVTEEDRGVGSAIDGEDLSCIEARVVNTSLRVILA
jgi:hypothetical protein